MVQACWIESRRALEMILWAAAPSERRMALPPRGSISRWFRAPGAQVENLLEPARGVAELALVDDQPGS